MNDAPELPASPGKTLFKVTLIVLGSLLLLGLISVVGARIYAPPTTLTIINSASQPITHCVLQGDQVGELFRAENIAPGETRKKVLHGIEFKGWLEFKATLADGTQRSGSFSYGDENSYVPSLSHEVTDQKLCSHAEIKFRFRLSDYW